VATCGTLLATITVGTDTVTMVEFSSNGPDRDYTAFVPFRFGRRHYVSAVDRVAAPVSTEQL
jgi:hypothetical protein